MHLIDDTARTAMQTRADKLAKWLRKNGQGCNQEQAHLDTDTQERIYWHYGYLMALRDILTFLDSNHKTLH